MTPMLVDWSTFLPEGYYDALARSAEDIKDGNFFAWFNQVDRRGPSIEDYLKRFHQHAIRSTAMSVTIWNATGGKLLRGNCVCMQWDPQRFLVTQLS